jgi:hypothetical protein
MGYALISVRIHSFIQGTNWWELSFLENNHMVIGPVQR